MGGPYAVLAADGVNAAIKRTWHGQGPHKSVEANFHRDG
jgi:hypothetical protein